MKPAPFEQFIKSLLDQAAASDALRDLTKRNIPIENSSLMSAVDAILLEESISAQFNPNGYDNYDKKLAVESKLNLIKMRLDLSLVIPEDPDYIMVQLCIKYLDKGYSLTKECMESLNVIYKKYA
jgi:hypothetical protein